MKLCRYDENRLGVVLDDGIHDVTSALDALPAQRYPLPSHDLLVAGLGALRPALEAAARKSKDCKSHVRIPLIE